MPGRNGATENERTRRKNWSCKVVGIHYLERTWRSSLEMKYDAV
jgi:hypothetical protein